MRFFAIFLSAFKKTFSFLFPEHCLLCGRETPDLCRECLEKIVESPAEQLGYVYSAFSYGDPRIKTLIRSFKYRKRRRLGEILSKKAFGVFSEDIGEIATFSGPVFFTSIPMPALRRFSRGYNHAEIIAREFSLKANIPYIELLTRTATARPQAKMRSKKDREENVRGTFTIRGKGREAQFAGTTILLVDDVITTGATLEEARRVLVRSGVKNVFAFTLAATPR